MSDQDFLIAELIHELAEEVRKAMPKEDRESGKKQSTKNGAESAEFPKGKSNASSRVD